MDETAHGLGTARWMEASSLRVRLTFRRWTAGLFRHLSDSGPFRRLEEPIASGHSPGVFSWTCPPGSRLSLRLRWALRLSFWPDSCSGDIGGAVGALPCTSRPS